MPNRQAFIVVGTSPVTGDIVAVEIAAPSPADAQRQAEESGLRGVVVGTVEKPVEVAASDAVPPLLTRAKAAPMVELVGFEGCTCLPGIRRSLTAALEGAPFTEVVQQTLPPRDPRRGYLSPTILVNGRDLFGLPVPSMSVMGCRKYPGGFPDMGCREYPGGLPDVATLRARLHAFSSTGLRSAN